MLSSAALAAFFLAGSLHAQEPPATSGGPAPAAESGISTPRRVAGLGVLAFLIGWMIWRSGSQRRKDGSQDQEGSHDADPGE